MTLMRVAAIVLVQLSMVAATPKPAVGQGAQTGVRPGRMLEVRREVRLTNRAPDWLAAPTDGRLSTHGLAMQPLQNSAVSYENESVGLLVGALRNVGTCAQDVSMRFQYVNAQWQPVGDPLHNEARITNVGPGELLPYRFRLRRKADFDAPPAGYVIDITAGTTAPADDPECPVLPQAFEVRTGKPKSTTRSYAVNGTVRLVVGGPIPPDGVTLTALLLDENEQVLEVLTGAPDVRGTKLRTGMLEDSQTVPFSMATPVPLAKWVHHVEVFAEVLPHAQVARPPQ